MDYDAIKEEVLAAKIDINKWAKLRIKDARGLPDQLADFTEHFWRKNRSGEYLEWQAYPRIAKESICLDELTSDERMALFKALHPGMELYLEKVWSMLVSRPYQKGYGRMAYRKTGGMLSPYLERLTSFLNVVHVIKGYSKPIEWFAVHAIYLKAVQPLSLLLAATIDLGGERSEAVVDILISSGNGEHEVGQMGRHVILALLYADCPRGWNYIEKMLLAAQRQEGLRQAIVESIDFAHIGAFKRMLNLLVEERLVRFSSVVRAVNVWLGYQWDSASEKTVSDVLNRICLFLNDREELERALYDDDPETTYLALWSLGVQDMAQVLPHIKAHLDSSRGQHRFVAAYLAAQSGDSEALALLSRYMLDDDSRLAILYLRAGQYRGRNDVHPNLFEDLVVLCERWPAKSCKLTDNLWPWCEYSYGKRDVADKLKDALKGRSPTLLIPYIKFMDPLNRPASVKLLGAQKEWDETTRQCIVEFVGNASSSTRICAAEALWEKGLTSADALMLERYLSRKSSELRSLTIALLQSRKDKDVLDSADRLLDSKKALCRVAGLELIRVLVENDRSLTEGRARAARYAEKAKLSREEEMHLEVIGRAEAPLVTRDDAFGMMDPEGRTPVVQPRRISGVSLGGAFARSLIEQLDRLIHEHAAETVVVKSYDDNEDEERLLGDIGWRFPRVDLSLTREANLERLPFADVWLDWYEQLQAGCQNTDGVELFRVWSFLFSRIKEAYRSESEVEWVQPIIVDHFGSLEKLDPSYPRVCENLLQWLLYLFPLKDDLPGLLLDALEDALARVPKEEIEREWDEDLRWRCEWRNVINQTWGIPLHEGWLTSLWSEEDEQRYFRLKRFMDEPGPNCERSPLPLKMVAHGVQQGYANQNDLIDVLLGAAANSRNISEVTRRGLGDDFKEYDFLLKVGSRCRDRILDIELQRGELDTPATTLARNIESIPGTERMLSILSAIGNEGFNRVSSCDASARAVVFSKLIRVSKPLPEDTHEAFCALVQEKAVDEQRLIDLALFAPQWAGFIEHALGWKEFAEAVWWIHAHTKDEYWTVDSEVSKEWEAQIAERTPLSSEELIDGTVDVQWFLRVYKSLKAAKWARIDAAAKYASGSAGHKRAQLFADAMLGKVKKTDLKKRITEKRNQDAVRAYGLLPLARGARRDNDILDRYKLFQEFLRGSRQFGSQRKDSEKRAVNVGMDNLARTAGYADPQRLAWAMEAREVSDMKDGRLEVVVDDVRVVLEVDEQAKVTTHVWRDDKVLKSIPAKLGKQKEIKALKARATSLRRQASRIRLSLEQAMCRGDVFSGAELQELMAHPLLGAYLRRLVLMGEVGMGYPEAEGLALRGLGGAMVAVGSGDQLRIAHPFDLLETGLWHHWQQDCFEFEVVQPFKQLFRELYVLTAAEKKKKIESERYAGHQVNPSQALALLGARGWVARPEEGVFRTFHELNLIATLSFEEYFFSPGEVEGLTISSASFHNRETGNPVPLESLPAAVFSEVMRDLDLVVSKAHRGGVDPEATASTVEMRASLLKETFRLLKIDHFEQKGDHIVIRGERASYSLHLGSGIIHTMPGGMLFIVPVHAQHRGRLFIPFADDDPKTAEIISKALMLARDKEIKDPQILEQLT